jgi:hypothetical protein
VDSGSAAAKIVTDGNYGETRFNALRHGILSRYTVLPWEDEADYQALLPLRRSGALPKMGEGRRSWPAGGRPQTATSCKG